MDIATLRQLFGEASKDAQKAKALSEHFKKSPAQEGLYLGYQAAAEALQAREAWMPTAKIYHLQQAQSQWDKAIEQSPEDIEIRFLRFSVELNTPKILQLSAHLSEDKSVILAGLESANTEHSMKRVIAKMVLRSGLCSTEEQGFLTDWLEG